MPPTAPQDEAYGHARQLVMQHAQRQQDQHVLVRPAAQRPRLPHAISGMAAVWPVGLAPLPRWPAAAAERVMRPAVPPLLAQPMP
jgi:hypothetical protein